MCQPLGRQWKIGAADVTAVLIGLGDAVTDEMNLVSFHNFNSLLDFLPKNQLSVKFSLDIWGQNSVELLLLPSREGRTK